MAKMTKTDVPIRPEGQALIDLLLDPERTREHLERLEEAHRLLDEKLAAIATLEEIEVLRAQASAALSEANTFRTIALDERKEAATFLARARTLAEDEAKTVRAGAEAYASATRGEISLRADAVAEREQAVAVAELAVTKREEASRALAQAAESKAAAAQSLQGRLEQKLQALRAIANE